MKETESKEELNVMVTTKGRAKNGLFNLHIFIMEIIFFINIL